MIKKRSIKHFKGKTKLLFNSFDKKKYNTVRFVTWLSGLATKLNDLSSIPRTYMVGEKKLIL